MMEQAVPSTLLHSTRQALLEALTSGNYAVGKPLPSQQHWARQLGVSAFVVRQALQSLKSWGLVESRQGSYTFLCRQPTAEDLRQAQAGGEATELSLWMIQPRDYRRMQQMAKRKEFQQQFAARQAVTFQERLIDFPLDAETEVLAGWLAGAGPSVGLVRRTFGQFLVDHDLVQPLVSAEAEQFAGLLHPRLAQACRHPQQDGLLLVPVSHSLSFLLLNRTVWRRAGLDADQPPTDWESFVQALKQLTRQGDGPALVVPNWDLLAWWLCQWIYDAMPAAQLNEHGANLPAIDWNSAAARAGVDLLHRLLVREQVAVVHQGPESVYASALRSGRLALGMGSYTAAMVADDSRHFSLAPMPVGASGTVISQLNIVGWYVGATVQGAQRRAAESFLVDWQRWTHLDEGGPQLLRAGVAPLLVSYLRDDQADRYVMPTTPHWRHMLGDLLDRSRLEPAGADADKAAIGAALCELFAAQPQPDVEQIHCHCRQATQSQYSGAESSAHSFS